MEYKEYRNAAALADWDHDTVPGACDTVHHVVGQALAQGRGDFKGGVNRIFPRVKFVMANFDDTKYPILKGLYGFHTAERGDTTKLLDPGRFHYIT